MDPLAALLAGALVGLVAGVICTAVAFLRVFRTKYVIPDDELQADLAWIIDEREIARERRQEWRALDDTQKRDLMAREEDYL